MKVKSERKLESANKETLKIELEWDPTNESEEGLVALVATLTDLVKQFNVLNTAASDD
jgi:hypothetical protein